MGQIPVRCRKVCGPFVDRLFLYCFVGGHKSLFFCVIVGGCEVHLHPGRVRVHDGGLPARPPLCRCRTHHQLLQRLWGGHRSQPHHPPCPSHTVSAQSPIFKIFQGPKNRFQGTNSARLCSLAGRYDNLISTRFRFPHRLFKNSITVDSVKNKCISRFF